MNGVYLICSICIEIMFSPSHTHTHIHTYACTNKQTHTHTLFTCISMKLDEVTTA